MINNLVKKRQIVSQEEELQRIKITLQQNELALLRLTKNLDCQYQNKYMCSAALPRQVSSSSLF